MKEEASAPCYNWMLDFMNKTDDVDEEEDKNEPERNNSRPWCPECVPKRVTDDENHTERPGESGTRCTEISFISTYDDAYENYA